MVSTLSILWIDALQILCRERNLTVNWTKNRKKEPTHRLFLLISMENYNFSKFLVV